MKPMVSIWCQSYNHKDYIRDAIEGFLMQKTNFSYEIVIHDDASTDGTIDILKEYEEKYSNLVRVIYQERNIFKNTNRKQILNQIKKRELHGKYIAFCEGDDYWIDPNKLQKQVDYLESHERCAMVAHNAIWRDCKTMEEKLINESFQSRNVCAKEIILQSPILLQTASIMVRKQYLFLPSFFDKQDVTDYPFKLHTILNGDIYYMNDVMSVYRYMAKGSWSSRRIENPKEHILHGIKMIAFLEQYNTHTKRVYEKYIIVQMNRYSSEVLSRIKRLEENEVLNLWKEINEETDSLYCLTLEKIYQCYKVISDEQLYISRLKNTLGAINDIILWGTGKFTKYYLECLEKHELKVKGFVVTKKEAGNEEFLGKKVWELQELLEEKTNHNLVVAVGFAAWGSVLDTIFEYKVEKYYCPFYYEIN